MCEQDELHVGDIGAVLRVLVEENCAPVNLSSASIKLFKFKRPGPNGFTFSRPAAFFSDGTDGLLQYTTVDITDLDQAGEWTLQVYLVLSGWTGHVGKAKFMVADNIIA